MKLGWQKWCSRIMALLDYPIKKFPARTKLHDQMNVCFVFVRSSQTNNIFVPSQMMHYLNFPLHIFNILGRSAHQLMNHATSVILQISGNFLYYTHNSEIWLSYLDRRWCSVIVIVLNRFKDYSQTICPNRNFNFRCLQNLGQLHSKSF